MVILPFCPANVFQPDKMVLQTYVQEDRPRGNRSGLYEFFRGKAWVCGHALVGMAKVSRRQKGAGAGSTAGDPLHGGWHLDGQEAAIGGAGAGEGG